MALFFGIFDGLKVAASSLTGADGQAVNGLAQGFIHVVDVMSPVLSKLPLYEEGMAWLLPTIATIVLCLVFGRGRDQTAAA